MPQSNQEKVACLDDNDARLAVDPRNKYRIQTKPHGHGDVHSLLYSSGLLKEWRDAGLKWVLFFQDTNGLLFKVIPASLGVSATRQYQVNSLAVVRKAKEAIGGITKLTHADDVGAWKYIEEHRHAYFDKMQENRLQEFKLPEPVLCIGGFLQVELLGRIQRQDMDGLYYIWQKLRRIEVALIEYRESLEERGIKNPEEIESKVAIHRKRLESDFCLSESSYDVSDNRKTSLERRDGRDDTLDSSRERHRSMGRSESPPCKPLNRNDSERKWERHRDRDRDRDLREKSGSRDKDELNRDRSRDRDRDRRRQMK